MIAVSLKKDPQYYKYNTDTIILILQAVYQILNEDIYKYHIFTSIKNHYFLFAYVLSITYF